jgi:transposase
MSTDTENPPTLYWNHVEYRPHSRFPSLDYRIGKNGTVIRFYRGVNQWREIRRKPTHSGYLYVVIADQHKRRNLNVAALVLSAFGYPRPIGCQPFFLDNNRNNCSLSNLRWAPARTQYRAPKPTWLRAKEGSSHHAAKLTEQLVTEARSLFRQGHTTDQLAKRYDVSRPTILFAVKGQTWKHVPDPVIIRSTERCARGNRFRRAKLTADKVRQARELRLLGATVPELAEEFGVSVASLTPALLGKTWKHIPNPVPPDFIPEPRIGTDSTSAKLTEDDVQTIRAQRQEGQTYKQIASHYGISAATAFHIIHRHTWRHVMDDTGETYMPPHLTQGPNVLPEHRKSPEQLKEAKHNQQKRCYDKPRSRLMRQQYYLKRRLSQTTDITKHNQILHRLEEIAHELIQLPTTNRGPISDPTPVRSDS